MKIYQRFLSFILVFSLTAMSVAAAALAVDTRKTASLPQSEIPSEAPLVINKEEIAPSHADAFSQRLTAPSYDNEYYYSDKNVFYKYGWGMPNCTCYAWGRAYEILGSEPKLSVYSAYLWYDYNLENGYYAYGSTPKLGAVACWVYASGTSGHVAVVEKIENGIITFSNSAYGGTEFYTSTAPVFDPSDGRDSWIFQGYIYIGEYGGDAPDTLREEGDVYRITSDNGVNFRSDAGTSASVLGAIGYGRSVAVTQTKEADGYTWGLCRYKGQLGWFVIDFAELVYRYAPDDGDDASASPADEPRYLMGDVDDDGFVSILDASRIQMVLAKYFTPTQYMITVGDFDGDSQLSVIDAVKIQKKLAGVSY